MATRLFPDDQMERLRSYPDIGTDELIRFFALTPAGRRVWTKSSVQYGPGASRPGRRW